jgi:hypothetical protein
MPLPLPRPICLTSRVYRSTDELQQVVRILRGALAELQRGIEEFVTGD